MNEITKPYLPLLMQAIRASVAAGERIMNIYTDPNADFEIERKADNSPLTLADREAQAVIARYLEDLPYAKLSEEGLHLPYAERKEWEGCWIIDPLDGTKEFIKRNGEFTVNIALAHPAPVLGVVYVPAQRVLYFGLVGWGAYKVAGIGAHNMDVFTLDSLCAQGQSLPLATSERPFTVVASRSHRNDETNLYIDALRAEHPDLELACSGSSLKICLVAEGSADVYPRFAPTMEWDTAAAHAVARAAGCEIWQADETSAAGGHLPEALAYNKEDLHNPWFVVKRNA